MARYAISVSIAYHDTVVEECVVEAGQSLQIGNSSALAVPVPAGVPYIARLRWKREDEVTVLDGRGEVHRVAPDEDLRLELGAVRVDMSLVRRFAFKRIAPPSWQISTAWFSIVLMATLVSWQFTEFYKYRCVLGDYFMGVGWTYSSWPECHPEQANNDNGLTAVFTAEYLARLLQEDYAGEDEGVISRQLDRPEGERTERPEHYYMPAGGEGPITEMGGAADVAPEPVRGDPEEPDSLPVPAEKLDDIAELWAQDVGTPIDETIEESKPLDGTTADGIPNEEAEDEPAEAIAEDVEGWGIPDWYDTKDEILEDFEIEFMIKHARQRLKIDPDDASALSTLSYYQYLAADFDGAEKTYDRYIKLYPDDAAGYNNKALVFKRRGEYAPEEMLYRVALAIEPEDETALNNLAVNLAHQARYDEALAVMKRLETLDPGDPYADLHRAKIYAEMGQDERALELLEAALSGMAALDTLHLIEFRQDIRVDPSFEKLRRTREFRAILYKYYGDNAPIQD